ncbi:MAG: hypothetical protein KAG99_05555 [Bacteroidales bacterium]|nr:hypothetical protein [Bacteroidales bacterium]
MKGYKHDIEPLAFLLNKYDFEIDRIEKISTGEKYTAVLLKNGNIGVCANLGHIINPGKSYYVNLDLKNFSHRIVVNAYFNALLNYSGNCKSDADIFDAIDFAKYNKIVMVGFIKPVAEQLKNEGVSFSVFDLQKEDRVLTPIVEQKKFMKEADVVILSSTSLSNGTFIDSINVTKSSCDIYMIGPSSIMAKEILDYKNIKMIFGAAFNKSDNRVLNIIQEGGGTRTFLKSGQKRCL